MVVKKSENEKRSGELIDRVRDCPCLYDMANEKYKDNQWKNNIWAKIATDLGFLDGQEAAATWKNLRAYFKKNQAVKKPSGSANDYTRKWVHFDAMAFVVPFIEERQEQSSSLAISSKVKEYEEENDQILPGKEQNQDEEFQQDVSNEERCGESTTEVTPAKKKRKINDPLEDAVVEMLKRCEDKKDGLASTLAIDVDEMHRQLEKLPTRAALVQFKRDIRHILDQAEDAFLE